MKESSASQIKLILPDPNEAKVERIAKKLGLTRVGWIFTDLVTEDSRKGTVKNYRGKKDSHFLSAEECIMAGYFQVRQVPCSSIHTRAPYFCISRIFIKIYVNFHLITILGRNS